MLARMADHDRIAADLHDHVIQELFALGMSLQGQSARSGPATAARMNGYIDTIDKVIGKIRASIFQLQRPGEHDPPDLRAELLELIEEHVPQLGFTPRVRLLGASRSAVAEESLADDILAVAREALSNCARHAQATAAEELPGGG